jgi:hypothetical protein
MNERHILNPSTPEHRHLQNRESLREAHLELVNTARHELAVATPALEITIWNSAAMGEAIGHFLARHPRNRARLVIEDTEQMLAYCPRLVELTRRYSDLLLIRRLGDAHRGLAEMFVLADRDSCLLQTDIRLVDATLDLAAPRIAAPHVQRFEQIWESSDPIAGLHGFRL